MTTVEAEAQFARIEVEIEETFCHLTHLLDQCDHGTLAAQYIVVLTLLLNVWKQECASRPKTCHNTALDAINRGMMSEEQLAAMEDDEAQAQTMAEEINEARINSAKWRQNTL